VCPRRGQLIKLAIGLSAHHAHSLTHLLTHTTPHYLIAIPVLMPPKTKKRKADNFADAVEVEVEDEVSTSTSTSTSTKKKKSAVVAAKPTTASATITATATAPGSHPQRNW
jgi:hypothetical protein